jgi:hypothetical protein
MEQLVSRNFWRNKLLTEEYRSLNEDRKKMYQTLFSNKYLLSCEVTEKIRNFIDTEDFSEIYNIITKETEEKRNFYEVIIGSSKQKIYFDIDMKLKECEEDDINPNEVIESFLTVIKQILIDFGILFSIERDFLLYSSHGETKRSYHFVLRHLYVENCEKNKRFYNMVLARMDKKYHKYIDCIYRSVQQYRTLYSQKQKSRRIKKREEYMKVDGIFFKSEISEDKYEEFKKSFVTYVDEKCKKFPLKDEPIEDIIHANDDRDVDYSEKIKEILDKTFGENLLEIKTRNENLYILRNEKGYYCKACDRQHLAENPFIIVSGNSLITKNIYFHCRRNPKNEYLRIGTIKLHE